MELREGAAEGEVEKERVGVAMAREGEGVGEVEEGRVRVGVVRVREEEGAEVGEGVGED